MSSPSPTEARGQAGAFTPGVRLATRVAWGVTPLRLLQLAAFTLLAGRAYLYLAGIGPLSTFFWHEGWLEGPLAALGWEWKDYAAHSEGLILHVQRLIGGVLALGAAAVWWVDGKRPLVNGTVLACVVLLLPYWLLRWVDKNYQWPMLLEHFLHWGTPMLLILFVRMRTVTWQWMVKVMIALTFIGHGLYALGWPSPRPAGFMFMTMQILGCSEGFAVGFLHLIAFLDFAAALFLFIPCLVLPALVWTTFWGLATAVARTWAHFTPAEDYYGLHPWFAESVLRLAHGLVPLALLVMHLRPRANEPGSPTSSPRLVPGQPDHLE